MSEYLDVLRQSIQLADTSLEALSYLSNQLKVDKRCDHFYLISDVIDGYLSIDKACSSLPDNVCSEYHESCADKVRDELMAVAIACEALDAENVSVMLDTYLIPRFVEWRAELARCFNPVILC